MDISVIIVSYNTKQLTLNCVKSIYKYTKDINFEIILVDNASTDGSVLAVKQEFPIVKVIESNENLGFGRANNLGVKHAQGEFLFFLNSDTILIENSLKKMYDFFVRNKKELKIGVLGSVLTDIYGNSIHSGGLFPKVVKYILNYFYMITNKVFQTNKQAYPESNYQSPITQVEMVTGADMFMLRQDFEKIGGFDKNFFLYFEETDLQFRLSKLGYKNYILGNTKIIHLEGGSMSASNWKRKIVQNSQSLYFRKNESKMYWLYLLFEICITPFRFLQFKYKLKENYDFTKSNIHYAFKMILK